MRTTRRGWIAWAALGAALFCVSCVASAEVQASKDPHYTGRIRSLYIAIGQGGIDEDFAVELDKALKNELGRRRVAVSSRILGGLELDPHLVEREVAAVHPDGVLLMRPVRGTTYDGTITNLTYDVSLVDMQTQARVWRAQINNRRASGTMGTVEGLMEETALKLVEQLVADNMLAGGG